MTTVERGAVWVESDRTPAGIYRATVHPNDDVSIPLGYAQATAYALAVIMVCEYADFDAAVVAQLQAVGVDAADAAAVVADMREFRRRPDRAATAPLVFSPIVALSDGRPYVHVHLRDEPLTQWTTDDARGHAMHVLSVAVAAHLDQRYHQQLTRNVGLSAEQAAYYVHTLRDHRQGNGDSSSASIPDGADA